MHIWSLPIGFAVNGLLNLWAARGNGNNRNFNGVVQAFADPNFVLVSAGIDMALHLVARLTDAERARALASSPAPTQAHSIDTALTLESIPSSIDPEGRLTPREKEVAILRARASLADSERRRFKEERKWAMSQGNTARAEQLAWQVRRFTTLMDSFHKEADAKVVEGEEAVST